MLFYSYFLMRYLQRRTSSKLSRPLVSGLSVAPSPPMAMLVGTRFEPQAPTNTPNIAILGKGGTSFGDGAVKCKRCLNNTVNSTSKSVRYRYKCYEKFKAPLGLLLCLAARSRTRCLEVGSASGAALDKCVTTM